MYVYKQASLSKYVTTCTWPLSWFLNTFIRTYCFLFGYYWRSCCYPFFSQPKLLVFVVVGVIIACLWYSKYQWYLRMFIGIVSQINTNSKQQQSSKIAKQRAENTENTPAKLNYSKELILKLLPPLICVCYACCKCEIFYIILASF